MIFSFHTFIYLQGSQTHAPRYCLYICFTPLFTYKVLKLAVLYLRHIPCFTPLFTYKVLKPLTACSPFPEVSHLYLLTRFSNVQLRSLEQILVSHLYLLTRFSNRNAWRPFACLVSHLYLLTRFSNYIGQALHIMQVSHLYLLTRFSNHSGQSGIDIIGFTPLFTYKVLKLSL